MEKEVMGWNLFWRVVFDGIFHFSYIVPSWFIVRRLNSKHCQSFYFKRCSTISLIASALLQMEQFERQFSWTDFIFNGFCLFLHRSGILIHHCGNLNTKTTFHFRHSSPFFIFFVSFMQFAKFCHRFVASFHSLFISCLPYFLNHE